MKITHTNPHNGPESITIETGHSALMLPIDRSIPVVESLQRDVNKMDDEIRRLQRQRSLILWAIKSIREEGLA